MMTLRDFTVFIYILLLVDTQVNIVLFDSNCTKTMIINIK